MTPPLTYPQKIEYHYFDTAGDTIFSSIDTVNQDSIPTPNIAESDYKVINYRRTNGEWITRSERYRSFSSRLPEYEFSGVRGYDNNAQVWNEGTYSISRVTGEFNSGNTIAFDTTKVGLFTSNPTVEESSQTTTSTQVISNSPVIVRRQIEVLTTPERGTVSAEVASQEEEFNSDGYSTRFEEKVYPIDLVTGQTRNVLLREANIEKEYMPGTDLPSFNTYIYRDYFPVGGRTITRRYFYSQVSSTEESTIAPKEICFDRTYFNGSSLIAVLSTDLGSGHVKFISIDGKQISEYQISAGQQLEIDRPQVSGIYFLSFSGAQGVCSQQVFVP
ncbi:MAG: hypothetical protein AB8F78_19450 [Saprospiraceae bacterium]